MWLRDVIKLLWSEEDGSGNLIDYTRSPENTTDYPDYTWNPADTTDYPDYTENPEITTDFPDYTWNPDYDQFKPSAKGTKLLPQMQLITVKSITTKWN